MIEKQNQLNDQLYVACLADMVRYMGEYQQLNPKRGPEDAAVDMVGSVMGISFDGRTTSQKPDMRAMHMLPDDLDLFDVIAYGRKAYQAQTMSDYHMIFSSFIDTYDEAEADHLLQQTRFGMPIIEIQNTVQAQHAMSSDEIRKESLADAAPLWADSIRTALDYLYAVQGIVLEETPKVTAELYLECVQDIVNYIGDFQHMRPELSLWEVGDRLTLSLTNSEEEDSITEPFTPLQMLPDNLDIFDVINFARDYQLQNDSVLKLYHTMFSDLVTRYNDRLDDNSEHWNVSQNDDSVMQDSLYEEVGGWIENNKKMLNQLYQQQKSPSIS